ncbi:hypothetical protein BKK42_29040 [Bacillus cereus]|nr:hypothetical protein BKK43_27460 [Bacillus cereus]ONG75792.1 hypothetical protein BKK42_29040 [Bacillus cereus]
MDSLSLAECVKKLGIKDSEVIVSFLEAQKQNGYIFYKEDLNTLSQDTQFDLYYYETIGFIKNNYAFPIPTALYYSLKIDKWSIKWLTTFHQLYYLENPPPSWEWQYWNIYMGKKFVWLYK